MVLSNRWEQGSDFHLMPQPEETATVSPWDGIARFYGSGRDTLRGLLIYGRREREQRRVWIPSYFCQTVVESLQSTGVEIQAYPDRPDFPAPKFENISFRRGDILLVMNFFGLRDAPSYEQVPRDIVAIIENHTHDPWSVWAKTSKADWCIASLRKTLPVPDGGVLWSPVGHSLPPEPPLTDSNRQAALEKLAAMSLKALYLEGQLNDKELFRCLATSGSSRIGSGEVSGMTAWTRALLLTFPLSLWRKSRQENHRAFATAISNVLWVRVLQPFNPDDCCPFSAILLFDSPQRRDFVRERLIASRVYPAILWSLESPVVTGIPPHNLDFSRRMLSIHCDGRYSKEDMLRVAELIIKIGNEFRNW